MWAFSACGVLIDISLVAIPVWIIVKNLSLSRLKALQISLIFCAGLFSVWAGVVRLVLIVRADLSTDV